MRRRPWRVYLGLGANLGDREANLREALRRLQEGVRLLRVAGLYETEPVGVTGQPWFLNTVAEVETALEPAALLAFVKGVELALGRAPASAPGPRPLDIDILLCAGRIIRSPDLTVPHPRLHERGFVLAPLAELAPRKRHPLLRQSIARLRREVPDTHIVRRIAWSSPPPTGAC